VDSASVGVMRGQADGTPGEEGGDLDGHVECGA
jgi:hypothetical protein